MGDDLGAWSSVRVDCNISLRTFEPAPRSAAQNLDNISSLISGYACAYHFHSQEQPTTTVSVAMHYEAWQPFRPKLPKFSSYSVPILKTPDYHEPQDALCATVCLVVAAVGFVSQP